MPGLSTVFELTINCCLSANRCLIIRHSPTLPSSQSAGINYANGRAMRASVSLSTEFGQEEARRRDELCAQRKREEGAKQWAQTREKISAGFRKAAKFAVIALIAVLAFIHRDELQQTIRFNYNRLVATRAAAPQFRLAATKRIQPRRRSKSSLAVIRLSGRLKLMPSHRRRCIVPSALWPHSAWK